MLSSRITRFASILALKRRLFQRLLAIRSEYFVMFFSSALVLGLASGCGESDQPSTVKASIAPVSTERSNSSEPAARQSNTEGETVREAAFDKKANELVDEIVFQMTEFGYATSPDIRSAALLNVQRILEPHTYQWAMNGNTPGDRLDFLMTIAAHNVRKPIRKVMSKDGCIYLGWVGAKLTVTLVGPPARISPWFAAAYPNITLGQPSYRDEQWVVGADERSIIENFANEVDDAANREGRKRVEERILKTDAAVLVGMFLNPNTAVFDEFRRTLDHIDTAAIREFRSAAPAVSAAAPVELGPERNVVINDAAGLLTALERERLSDRISSLQESTGVQFALVTSRVIPERFSDALSFARDQGSALLVGGETERGVVILVSVDDRKCAIAAGSGLNIPESDVQRILSKVLIPELKERAYATAFWETLDALVAEMT